jgi:hypothetical protein
MYIDKTIRDAIRSASHRRGSVASLAREAGVGEDLFGSWLRFRHRFTRAKTWAKVYPVLKQDLPQGKYVPESEKQMQLPLSATVLQRLHQVLIKAIQTQVLDSLTVPEKLQFLHLVKVALVNKHEFEYAAQTRDLEKELRPVQDSVPAAVPVPAYGIEWTPEQEPVPVSTKPHPLTFGAPLFKEYECNKWESRVYAFSRPKVLFQGRDSGTRYQVMVLWPSFRRREDSTLSETGKGDLNGNSIGTRKRVVDARAHNY